MNILYVAPDIPIPHSNMFVGGSTHVLEISRNLTKLGNKVIILARRNAGQLEYEIIEDNISVYRVYRGIFKALQSSPSSKIPQKQSIIFPNLIKLYFSTIYRPILISKAISIIKKEKIDAVLDRNSSQGIGIFAAYLSGIPSYCEVIDPIYSNLSLKLSKNIFAYTLKIFPKELHDKIMITTAGADLNKFNTIPTTDIRKIYNINPQTPILIYVGEDSSWHGVDDIISLSKILPPNIKIFLIGKNLEKYASNNIITPGFIPHNEIKNYLLASDIALAPYNPKNVSFMAKGFCFSPIKIFEYMACGKPIIASDIDIVDEIILNSHCGMLYPPGNIKSFTFAITELLKDKETMEEMNKNALKSVKNYTWNKVAEQISITLNINK